MQPVSYTRCLLGQHCNPCSVSRRLFLWPSSVGLALTRLLEGIGHNLFPSPPSASLPRLFRDYILYVGHRIHHLLVYHVISLSLSRLFLSACPYVRTSRGTSLLSSASDHVADIVLSLSLRDRKVNRLLSAAAFRVIAEEKALSEEEKKRRRTRSDEAARRRCTKGEEIWGCSRVGETTARGPREPTPFNLQLIAGN